MKAYKVWDCQRHEYGSTIVFAESRGKAKSIATRLETFDDSNFVDIRVNRCERADGLYKGNKEIDWDDPDTRLVLVRDLGWYCYDEDCEECVTKEYCLEYLRRE